MSSTVSNVYLSQVFTLKYFALSGGALLVYDYLLTFRDEVEYIWKAPWSVVKAGFLLHRYGNLIGQTVITLEEIGCLGPVTKEFCRAFCLYAALFMFISSETVRFVVLMRAWAVWRCRYRVTVWLVTLYTLYFFALIGVASYFWKYGAALLPVGGTCLAGIGATSWSLWIGILVIDSAVMAMVCFVCYNLGNMSSGFWNAWNSPLIRLLIRDTILFYIATVFNNCLSIVCWTKFRQDPRVFLQLVFSCPLLSIAGQRLVLNLRGLRARSYTSSYVSRLVEQELAAMHDEWEQDEPFRRTTDGPGALSWPAG